jgi:citrate lyase subunit beta/citryl-CoA lyase
MKEFQSGRFGVKLQSDCRVTYSPYGELNLNIKSSVMSFFGESLKELVRATMDQLGVQQGSLQLEDFGALPFVIQARIEDVIHRAFPDNREKVLPEVNPESYFTSARDRFRRSRLYLPGNQPKLMLNAGLHKPDGIILDLEDAVAPAEKPAARLIVRNALRVLDFFNSEKMVRVNQGELGLLDLEEIVPENVNLILLPKIESASEMRVIDDKVDELEKQHEKTDPIYFMPIIESALGVLNALEIARASERNVALAIGLEDYTADLGTQRTTQGHESFFARSMLINAARATGLQAIDTVFSDVCDDEGLRKSVLEAKSLGFDGKGCIHPRQIRTIHQAILPAKPEIEKALKIQKAFLAAEEKGLGVVSLGSKMIDAPVVKRALTTVRVAEKAGIIRHGEWL